MPVELSDLLSDERWVEVEMSGHTFNVAYRPGSMSLLRQAEMQKRIRLLEAQEVADEMEMVDFASEAFCEMVCAWDLVRKGEPLPLTPEVVARLESAIVDAIRDAIGEDAQRVQNEKKASNAISDAISPRADRRAKAQNGTSSSERRATWA